LNAYSVPVEEAWMIRIAILETGTPPPAL